jgi:hypothetical protein
VPAPDGAQFDVLSGSAHHARDVPSFVVASVALAERRGFAPPEYELVATGVSQVLRPRSELGSGGARGDQSARSLPLEFEHQRLEVIDVRQLWTPEASLVGTRMLTQKARPGLRQSRRLAPSIRAPKACCGQVASTSASSPIRPSRRRFRLSWWLSRSRSRARRHRHR